MSYETITGYTHSQTVASTSWVITHNLGTNAPVVDCWVDVLGNKTKILPLSVVATSDVQVTITFSSAYTGEAFVA